MFSKILIANRGEIACRIIRTAHRMGIATVAVYSTADANAPHVRMAGEARAIGGAPARESYLDIGRILQAARETGAQAIHPGYGFLSENPEFADACAAAGIVFIGPPASSMRAMGSKAAAKALMAQAGVPLVPGYHGDAQDGRVFAEAAASIGYPVLIKASAGGGGRGMRVVSEAGALADALEGAAREAAASFGDGRLLIEKYLTRPRHIEIQVFADTHGQCISLFERDCSIQRRHQKVLEESPAPFMTEARRAEMGTAATAAASAVDYVGAGTVEFIAEGDAFYFMEMNTRLQVEHPVTEMVTGLDLVEWQLRVADGERLPPAPASPQGHAIEARIYAEDPARDFLPSIGRLSHLRLPEAGNGVRVDSGVQQGGEITPYYDSMIAKLIVQAEDRPQAVRKLAQALDACEIVGVQTNLGLLRAVCANGQYAGGHVDTGFIGRHPEVLQPGEAAPALGRAILAAVVLDILSARTIAEAADPFSPWDDADAWRLNGEKLQEIVLDFAGERYEVTAMSTEDGAAIKIGGQTLIAERIRDIGRMGDGAIRVDGGVYQPRMVTMGATRTVILNGTNYVVHQVDTLAPPAVQAAAAGSLAAPIPARVTRILVTVDEAVTKGATLLTLEAMKMEISITAPFDGTVSALPHAVGEMVQEGTILAVLAPA